MGDIIAARFSRRDFLRGSLAATAIAATVSPIGPHFGRARARRHQDPFRLTEVEAGIDERHHVAEGYDADVLLRWGDALFPDSPAFDPKK